MKRNPPNRDKEITDVLAELGQDLLNGREPKGLPKRQMLAALIIAYTTQVMDYNVKRMHGDTATEPPTLLYIIDKICDLFDYNGA